MKQMTFTVIGGDLRQVAAARALAEDGYSVRCYLTEEACPLQDGIQKAASLEEAMQNTDVVLLPLPVSTDDKTVRTAAGTLPFEELFFNKAPLYTGGKAGLHLLSCAREAGCRFVDYFHREELNILNAVPTAEGAVAIAMEELPITLSGARCLILGFGRIGKLLAHRLRGLGARVTCAARRSGDLAWIEAFGYQPLPMEQREQRLGEFDVIFNTAPALLLPRQLLSKTKPEVLLIDLASKPGGIDFTAAKELGRNAVWALSLPGKVAPLTAGTIIKDTVLHLLQEEAN